jgi:hypothetical protein
MAAGELNGCLQQQMIMADLGLRVDLLGVHGKAYYAGFVLSFIASLVCGWTASTVGYCISTLALHYALGCSRSCCSCILSELFKLLPSDAYN